MGGKPSAPAAPSYAPQQQAALLAFQSDMAASENLYGLGATQLPYANQLTAASGQTGQDMLRAMQDAQNWGRQQFNTVWPYALDYLSSQQAISDLAGENASEAVIAQREARARADELYRRYQSEFAPIEDRFAREALDYNTPARAEQASGAAQADVRAATDAAQRRREQELRSLGIDPSEARYQGESALAGIYGSAAQAGAGTQARRQQEATGNEMLLAAAQMGQQLPTSALQILTQASQGVGSALQAGQYGGQGLTAATGLYGAGTTAGGSPVAYGYMANPYTALAGTQAGLTSNLYGYGTSALGHLGPVIGASTSAANNQFTNQLAQFNADAMQDQAMWGGIGKAVGGIGSIAFAPVTGGGSLIGNALSPLFT